MIHQAKTRLNLLDIIISNHYVYLARITQEFFPYIEFDSGVDLDCPINGVFDDATVDGEESDLDDDDELIAREEVKANPQK